jgi:hypothetical protein
MLICFLTAKGGDIGGEMSLCAKPHVQTLTVIHNRAKPCHLLLPDRVIARWFTLTLYVLLKKTSLKRDLLHIGETLASARTLLPYMKRIRTEGLE